MVKECQYNDFETAILEVLNLHDVRCIMFYPKLVLQTMKVRHLVCFDSTELHTPLLHSVACKLLAVAKTLMLPHSLSH